MNPLRDGIVAFRLTATSASPARRLTVKVVDGVATGSSRISRGKHPGGGKVCEGGLVQKT
jgi:hypothetical protein